MKLRLIVVLLVALVFPNAVLAQWWNPFGPSNYEDCVLEGMKTARNRDAVRAVQSACASKFFPDRKLADPQSEKRKSELLKKCGLDTDKPAVLSGKNRRNARVAVGRLASVELDGSKLSFQNRNDFAIAAVGISLAQSGGCDWDLDRYPVTLICKDGVVHENTFGSLFCPTEVQTLRKKYKGFCIIGIAPDYEPSEGFAITADRHGLCN